MLGRLARWLRALGHDTLFDTDPDDDDLARIATTRDRLLLTRDRRLCHERGDPDWCMIVDAPKPADQLRHLHHAFGLFRPGWQRSLFSRCLLCNATLVPASYSHARPQLPPNVRADPRVRSAGFRQCPECRRVYWEGSHTRRMRRWLHALADSL